MSSPLMQDLFAAAREDGPSDVVRDEVWGRVVAATAAPAGAAVAAKAIATPAGGKLLAVGAVIGATSAAVAALALNAIDPEVPTTTSPPRRTPAVVVSGPTAGARLAEAAPRPRTSAHDPVAVVTTAPSVARVVAAEHDEASALAEEARLVTEARAALVRGDADRALLLARGTHRLSARALEPEELALEARALRALNRTDEALATELTLRRRFPNHALSR